MRSTREAVTFYHPFTLRGLDGRQPAGTYMVVTEEEQIPGLSFVAWKRVMTVMYLPAIGLDRAKEQAVSIDPQDLAAAVKADSLQETP